MGSQRRTCFERECVMALRSSKVVDFGTNRKRVCDFLLSSIVTSVLSCSVSEILQVSLENDPTLFHPNFRDVPLGLECRCLAPRSEDPKLIIRVINFALVQSICPRYINVTDRRTTYSYNTPIKMINSFTTPCVLLLFLTNRRALQKDPN